MVYAQIKNGLVYNTIVLNRAEYEELFESGFDELVRIDEMDLRPGVGWSYDNGDFTAPEPTPEEPCCEDEE